jgi:hypothetical protein
MKPRIFVASSKESIDIAYAVQENLDQVAEVTVWNQGIFELSQYTLDSLVNALDDFDFGVFIFSADDIVKIRNSEFAATRDNVVFELGLFVGRLGRERNFIVIPNGLDNLRLPTDLLGITPTLFEPDRQDKNVVAALGPSCNRIKKAINKFGEFKKTETNDFTPISKALDENDMISIIQSWMGSRPAQLNTQVIKFSDVDRQLSLKPGTAEKYIELAARKWRYTVERKGNNTILFKEEPLTVNRRSWLDNY